MKQRNISFLLAVLLSIMGASAQSLVFHHAGGEKTTVQLPATFTVTPTGDKLVVDDGGGNVVELAKDEVMCVTYRDATGDVNGDQRVDVADVSTVVSLIIGAGGSSSSGNAPKDAVAVDLGLPSGTKWANMNVGAERPEDYGNYFAWGETKAKNVYDWFTYIHCDGTRETCHDIGTDIAGTQYDAATANWGDSWCMPTVEQFKELLDNTTSELVEQNGVYGCKFTGSNGGTIFLPAAGDCRDNVESYNAGDWGYYRSSTLDESKPYYAYFLFFYSGGAEWGGNFFDRSLGHSVRPVRKN